MESPRMQRNPRGRWQRAALAALATCLVGLGVFGQGTVRLEGDDPVRMGQLEAQMWRSYYEGRWLLLGVQTARFSTARCGFSLWNGARLAWHAARAAYIFRKRGDDPRCQVELEAYYALVARAARQDFPVAEAATLELEWWRERRRNVAPEDYAVTIARLAALIYRVPAEAVLPAARARAEAMAYRDARRDGRMTETDWRYLEARLAEAYRLLHAAIRGAGG